MIGSLNGQIEFSGNNYLVINVNGVGYKVIASSVIIEKTKKLKDKVKLFISTQMKENSLSLYGFDKIEDLKVFEQLLQVSGIGPKTAISVFDVGSGEEIKNAIAQNDVSFFTAVSGVGKRSAQRIIIDLKSKIDAKEEFPFKDIKEYEDVVLALKSLGYSSRDAHQGIQEIVKNNKKKTFSTEELLKLCLKNIGNK